MRSRYTAYVRRDQAYLLRTWHPSTRPGELHLDQPASPNWISLGILGSSGATAGVVEATVEFAADYMLDGRRGRMHELSRFVHENGHWYYLDGETRDTPHSRPGRNDSCPCGSGRKFKRCCGK